MQDFFAMGGYGFYVWGSMIVTAVLMLLEPLLLRRRRQQLLRRIGRSGDRARMRSQRRQQQMDNSTKVSHETQT